MPRLVGKKSNHGLLTGVVLVTAIAAAGAVEYLGYTNFVPGWGKDYKFVSQTQVHPIAIAIPHSIQP